MDGPLARKLLGQIQQTIDAMEETTGFRFVMVPIGVAREMEERGYITRREPGGWELTALLGEDEPETAPGQASEPDITSGDAVTGGADPNALRGVQDGHDN